MIRRVAFQKAIWAGALGAFVWEICFRILTFFLPLKSDLVYGLGTLVHHENPVWIWWPLGMLIHALVGGIWAIFYAYFFWSVLNLRPTLQGLCFSIIPSLAAGLSLMPQFKFLDSRIFQGEIPELGFFAINMGWQGPLSLFAFHALYGLTLGSLYQRPVGYSVDREKKALTWKKAKRSLPFSQDTFHSQTFPPRDFMFCTGIECSYPTLENGKWRVDEMELCGHYQKWEKDLELVAKLGIRYLRYGPPLPWIFKAPGVYDWSFLDAVMNRMRALGITPMIDLCHFGLPAWMGNFQNKEFPKLLAEYASAMAHRYPWVQYWNPVNEIYVASRESALHGSWNEQLRSEAAFVRATCNMVQASHLIMNEILKVQSDAIFFTSESSEFYQACCPHPRIVQIAEFENQRRFIASDLLHSRPVREDIKKYLLENGMLESEYESFMQANLSSKIIMGLDYYPWNEKLINTQGKAESLGELFGWYVITKQYYERYRRPLFHSETNSLDANQGPDWLWRQWHNIQMMRKEGIPVVGFTWYSLHDQIDWDIAVSKPLGNVNPVGLFDFNRDPRPAMIAYQQLLKMYRSEKISPSVFQEART